MTTRQRTLQKAYDTGFADGLHTRSDRTPYSTDHTLNTAYTLGFVDAVEQRDRRKRRIDELTK